MAGDDTVRNVLLEAHMSLGSLPSDWEERNANHNQCIDALHAADGLFAAKKIAEAEQAYLHALAMCRREDPEETVYALQQLGRFYHRTDRKDQALELYQEAFRLNTDIPATLNWLMELLAERGDGDGLFEVAERSGKAPVRAAADMESTYDWAKHLPTNYVLPEELPKKNESVVEWWARFQRLRAAGAAHNSLMNLLYLVTHRAPSNELALEWLARIQGLAEAQNDPVLKFEAWGQRGHFCEKAGDLATAISSYEEAIEAGTTDRLTYTRLLMAYETGRRWVDLLTLAERALTVQQDASWELDLRKRIERARMKSGVTAPSERRIIPAFNIRKNPQNVTLLAQFDVSPPAGSLAPPLGAKELFMACGASVMLYDPELRRTLWKASISSSSALLLSDGVNYVAVTQSGRIGDGTTQFAVFDRDGKRQCSWVLPDKSNHWPATAANVHLAGTQLITGCHDGFLYSQDLTGQINWRFAVPERDYMPGDDELLDEEDEDGKDDDEEELELHFFAESDSPRRPWPDYISVSPEGDRILFGSYDKAFMLDGSGHLLWTWRTRKHEQVSSLLTGPRAHLSIVASEEGSLNILDRDGNLLETHRSGEGPYSVAASSGLEQFVCSHAGGLSFYRRDSGLVRRHPRKDLPFNGFLTCTVSTRPDGERVVAWRDRGLLVFDGSGRLLAEIEFARRMGPPVFDANGDILVAAGKLIRLSVNSRLS